MGILTFPGASTPGRTIDGSASPVPDIAANGVNKALDFKDIAEAQFDALKDAADLAKDAADLAIEQAMLYNPGTAPGIDYVIPSSDVTAPGSLSASATTASSTFTPVAMSAFSGSFTPGAVPAAATATAPSLPTVTLSTIPVAPAATSVTAPVVDVTAPTAPTYSAPTLFDLVAPVAPDDVSTTLPSASFGDAPQSLTVSAIDLTELLAAESTLETLLAFTNPAAEMPGSYSETFVAPRMQLGAWAQSATFANKEATNKQRLIDRRAARAASPALARLWKGRTVLRSAALQATHSSYGEVTKGREQRAQTAADEARHIRYVYEETVLQRSAYLALFDAVNELDLQRVQIEIDVISTSASAEIEKVKTAISKFNAEVAKLAAQAEAYAAQLKTYDAAVQRFKAQVENEATKGSVNEARARAFDTKTRAESAKQQTFDAALSIEKQKLDVLASQVNARGIALSTAQVKLEKYKAEALKHSNSLMQTRGEFRVYSTRAATTAAANRAQAAKARVEAAKTQVTAQDARRELANVEAENATLRAAIITRTAKLQETIAKNSAAVAEADAKAVEKAVSFAATTVSAAKNRANAGLAADAAQAAARFVSAATPAASQATQLSQSVNNTLANAYAALYEAAGRAAAAVTAGEFSGYRASKSVSASYNISGSQDFSNSETQVRQISVSEDDVYSSEPSAV